MRNLGFFLIDGLNEIARFWRIRHIKPETTRSEQIELNSTTSRIIQQQNAIYPQCEKCQTTINEHWPLPMFSLKFPGPT